MKNIVLLTSLLIAGHSYATDIEVVGKITHINNWEGIPGTLITIENKEKTSGYCSRNDEYILPTNHPFYQQNFSMLLASQMAGKSIGLRMKRDGCVNGFPRIYHVKTR